MCAKERAGWGRGRDIAPYHVLFERCVSMVGGSGGEMDGILLSLKNE